MPYGKQPSWHDVKARFWWDVRNVFNRHDVNPYVAAGEGDSKPKKRTGFEDITHATKNLWVEWRRLKK